MPFNRLVAPAGRIRGASFGPAPLDSARVKQIAGLWPPWRALSDPSISSTMNYVHAHCGAQGAGCKPSIISSLSSKLSLLTKI